MPPARRVTFYVRGLIFIGSGIHPGYADWLKYFSITKAFYNNTVKKKTKRKYKKILYFSI